MECFNIWKCNVCSSVLNSKIEFQKHPDFLFAQVTSTSTPISIDMLPKTIEIDSQKFNLLFGTFRTRKHFKSILIINGSCLLFDDLQPDHLSNEIPEHKINTAYFYRV
jgi:hypothetical protein